MSIKDNRKANDFLRTFRILTYKHSPWKVWSDFITMAACTISNALDKQHYEEREKLYLDTIKKYEERDRNLFPKLFVETVLALEENSEQDFLGTIFMELDMGNEAKGQYFTPYSVCELNAELAIANDITQKEVKEKGFVSINDCASGSGALLIAGIHAVKRQLEKENLNFQNHVLAVAQDVDYTAALMCYIQLSLLGVAGFVKIGNTLTEPIASGDTLENYWFTPMYFSKVWVYRRLFKKLL